MSSFEHLSKLRPHLLRDGIKARAVNGERVTMAVIDLEPHAISPEHRHENEQPLKRGDPSPGKWP